MNLPSLVLVSAEDAFAPFHDAMRPYELMQRGASQGFINTLVDRPVALIFVDSQYSDWRALTLACKSSAATRRIPLCLVSDDAAVRAHAIDCGADLALGWAEFAESIAGIVADFARIADHDTLQRLACECGQPLPPLAADGIRQFNAGEYYAQHDLLEELWMATGGPVRDLYRAILQIGVAYYQIERGNYRGGLKMLQRSVQWMRNLPDNCQGVDVAKLRRDSYAVRAELQRLGPEAFASLDRALLQPVVLSPAQPPST